LGEPEKLLMSSEKYCYEDIFIFYPSVKVCYLKKNWDRVKYFREKYINVPDEVFNKKQQIVSKNNLLLHLELETGNEDLKNWDSELFVFERAVKLLIHLQTAETMIGKKQI
jgi:hypothetical protein